MKKLLALMIPILLLSGCLGSAEKVSRTEATPDNFDFVWSYQFDNALPMSSENITEFTLNETSEIVLTVWTRFHEPDAWEQGYGNLTLYGPDNYTWSWQTSDTNQNVLYINLSQAGNYTLRIQASGSDDLLDNFPGDAIIVETEVTTRN